MNVLDLFSGIGGFSLGLERAGMRTVAFCEIEPYCRAVLAHHWAAIPCFPDIRGIDGYELGRLGRVDVICGGFPCQDISAAGKGAGITGARSGLWSEYARVVGLVRPRYVIVENVATLLSRGLGTVLGDLAALGYDAEWHCIPASAVGAPHRRDRVWIVAYPHLKRFTQSGELLHEQSEERDISGRQTLAHPNEECESRLPKRAATEYAGARLSGWWESEPDVGRVAHGVPARVDRLKALGNSIIPQIAEIIGRAIVKDSELHPPELFA